MEEIKFGSQDFSSSVIETKMLRKYKQVWVSHATNCKGVAFDIVEGAESPSESYNSYSNTAQAI